MKRGPLKHTGERVAEYRVQPELRDGQAGTRVERAGLGGRERVDRRQRLGRQALLIEDARAIELVGALRVRDCDVGQLDLSLHAHDARVRLANFGGDRIAQLFALQRELV